MICYYLGAHIGCATAGQLIKFILGFAAGAAVTGVALLSGRGKSR